VEVSIAEAHNRLSYWLKKVSNEPITITRRGEPVGVIISPEEYEHTRQVSAFWKMLSLSQSLQDSGVAAEELFRASREELEGRP
jgi:prevent-host-death family protein